MLLLPNEDERQLYSQLNEDGVFEVFRQDKLGEFCQGAICVGCGDCDHFGPFFDAKKKIFGERLHMLYLNGGSIRASDRFAHMIPTPWWQKNLPPQEQERFKAARGFTQEHLIEEIMESASLKFLDLGLPVRVLLTAHHPCGKRRGTPGMSCRHGLEIMLLLKKRLKTIAHDALSHRGLPKSYFKVAVLLLWANGNERSIKLVPGKRYEQHLRMRNQEFIVKAA